MVQEKRFDEVENWGKWMVLIRMMSEMGCYGVDEHM